MHSSDNHVVLARRWRPRTFSQIVGQDHVVRALTYALDHQMVHHAYLLTGSRGVGKTTLARLLSQALNCVRGVSSAPCGTCAACTSIAAGHCVDCIEIDAALHTRVDDIRELLDNALYPPAQVRYKVYVIDEVHMLSASAFQALLKSLEEPPPYLQFILATTDPQKMPPAVLSRCLHLTLRLLPISVLVSQLAHICTAENIVYDADALPLMAQAAAGSMRDALSLLDQVRAYGQGQVRLCDVSYLLGVVSDEAVAEMLTALYVHRDLSQARQQGQALLATCHSVDRLFSALLVMAHQGLLLVSGVSSSHQTSVHRFLSALSGESLNMLYQITVQSRKQAMSAPDEATALDICLIRLYAYHMSSDPVRFGSATPVSVATEAMTEKPMRPMPSVDSSVSTSAVPTSASAWQACLAALSLSSGARRLAESAVWEGWTPPAQIALRIDRASHALLQTFESSLGAALSAQCGTAVVLHFSIEEAAVQALTGSAVASKKSAQEQRKQEAQRLLLADPACEQLCTLFDAQPDWASLSETRDGI